MKEEDRKFHKENLKRCVEGYSKYRKGELGELEEKMFMDRGHLRDGNTLWKEVNRFKRLKEIKGILGRWSKKVDKKDLGMIIGIRKKLKDRGFMEVKQLNWFLFKLGLESNDGMSKLRDMWNCIVINNETEIKGKVYHFMRNYGIVWDLKKGIDVSNLKKIDLSDYLTDMDYRNRIGKRELNKSQY
jgi:hypothetical protein